jgi:integrase/recombinase XerC
MPTPSSIKFSRALYDFEAFLEVEKNLSPRTRRAYVYDLERFADAWIKKHGSNPTLDRLTTEDIKKYLEDLRMNLHYKSTTLSRVIASIRIFFEYCVEQKLLESSPAAILHNPKNPKRLPIFLVEGEMKRLMATPERMENVGVTDSGSSKRKDYEPLGTRDYAILVTLGFTGLRLMELVNLGIRDIDFESKFVRVMGKGSKERIVPLNALVISALREWLEIRPASEDDAVFLNRFGKKISTRGVEKLVDKHVQRAGIAKDKISPHKLRHTFATLLHMNGVDILEIQALLGHSSITSTQIYTHASSERLKSAVKKIENI